MSIEQSATKLIRLVKSMKRLRQALICFLFLVLLVLSCVSTVLAQEIRVEEWVARYNGPGNSHDYALALAVDGVGNVYVTGYSIDGGTYYDYATAKYDTHGNQLWMSRYDGPANDFDGAFALVVDGVGNVYVTGESYGVGTSQDYATIKYDTDGKQLWLKRYNGPGNSYDGAHALAVDGAGNVYVTGGSYGGTYQDYATINYDKEGNELWIARYNGPGNSRDYARTLAVDGAGNVYVTGYSYGSGTYQDYATIKYSQNQPPMLDPIGNKTTNEGQLLAFTIFATAPDRAPLTYSASNLPTGASFDPKTKTFSWTPGYDQAGVYTEVHFEVTNGTDTDSQDITITVVNVNRPPVADAGIDQTVEGNTTGGGNVTLDGSGSNDPDNDPLTYYWSWDGGTAEGTSPMVWLPLGTTVVTLVVNDGTEDSAPDTIEIIVQDTIPPETTINSPEQRDYLRIESLVLDFDVTDICSSAEYTATLDGSVVINGQLLDLLLLPLGYHTLTVSAHDSQSNDSDPVSVTFNLIASAESLGSTVEEMFNEGLIDDPNVRDSLLNQINAVIKRIERDQTKPAKNILNAFINHVCAQADKHIVKEAAEILAADVRYVISYLQNGLSYQK